MSKICLRCLSLVIIGFVTAGGILRATPQLKQMLTDMMNKTQIYFRNLLFEIMNKKYVWNVVRWSYMYSEVNQLTHWGRVTHICVGKLTIIGPDNGLSPGRRQAIIWTYAGILLIRPRNKLQWKFNRNSNIFIQENALENVVCQMASICLGLNVLKMHIRKNSYILSYFPPTLSGIFVSVLQSMVKLKFCINVKCSASSLIGL